MLQNYCFQKVSFDVFEAWRRKTMNIPALYSRDRVAGFLRANGKRLVNEKGEEILLVGWGLGNWLLNEGYMWGTHHPAFDRYRKMERIVRELAGTQYAAGFWKRFRDQYVTESDIRRMAEIGCNSVRIPFNWRLFMEDEPGITFKEEGFALIDRCLDWCEKYRIYAFLDMHGAPGGQTGTNIDDCVDEFPRLYQDADSWEKGIALWGEFARRYADRWIVGGYDLLNEPIRTADHGNVDYFLPKLALFYDEAIAEIRKWDTRHVLSIEGHHWASSTEVFHKKYDENMLLHFHRYWCTPDISSYREYLDTAERLDCPLWLGETGENRLYWFSAMYPLALRLGIGINIWPWKKIGSDNCPCGVKRPEGWDEFIGYIEGGARPSYERAWQMFDEYLENCRIENCIDRPEVMAAVLRTPGCRIRATDFDETLGDSPAYHGLGAPQNLYAYRAQTGLTLVPADGSDVHSFFPSKSWDVFALRMRPEEFVSYTLFGAADGACLAFEYSAKEHGVAEVYQDGRPIGRWEFQEGTGLRTEPLPLSASDQTVIRIQMLEGTADLLELDYSFQQK